MPTFVAELTGELLRRTLQYDQYRSAETFSVGIYNKSSMLLLECVQKPQTSEFQRGWENRRWSRCLADTWICCTCYLFKNIFTLEGFPIASQETSTGQTAIRLLYQDFTFMIAVLIEPFQEA